MADSVDHTLYCWGNVVFNTSIDLAMSSKTQGYHSSLLLLIGVANQTLYLGNSDFRHNYPLNTLSRVMPLWVATVIGSRNCSRAWNVALTTL